MAKAPAPPRPNPPTRAETDKLYGRPRKGETTQQIKTRHETGHQSRELAQGAASAIPGSFIFDDRPITVSVRDIWLESRAAGCSLTIIIEDQSDETSDFIAPFLLAGIQLPVRFTFVCHFKGGKLFQASAAGRACFSGQTSPVRQLKLSALQQEGREQHA